MAFARPVVESVRLLRRSELPEGTRHEANGLLFSVSRANSGTAIVNGHFTGLRRDVLSPLPRNEVTWKALLALTEKLKSAGYDPKHLLVLRNQARDYIVTGRRQSFRLVGRS